MSQQVSFIVDDGRMETTGITEINHIEYQQVSVIWLPKEGICRIKRNEFHRITYPEEAPCPIKAQ